MRPMVILIENHQLTRSENLMHEQLQSNHQEVNCEIWKSSTVKLQNSHSQPGAVLLQGTWLSGIEGWGSHYLHLVGQRAKMLLHRKSPAHQRIIQFKMSKVPLLENPTIEPCSVDIVGWVQQCVERRNCIYYLYLVTFFGFIDMKKIFK